MSDLPVPAASNDADLEKLVGFTAELADAAGEMLNDGHLSLLDFKALNMASEAMHGFLTIDRTKLMPELKDLLTNTQLVSSLANLFMEKFDVPETNAMAMAQEMLPLAVDLYQTTAHAIACMKKFKSLVGG